MRDDGPRRAPQLDVGRRITLDQRPAGGYGAAEILERIEILRGGAEHDRRVLVLGERICKLQRAIDRCALQRRLLVLAGDLQLLAMRDDRGVAGRRGALVRRVLVGRSLVLARGLAERAVLEQQVRELIVDPGRLLVLRERRQERAIPDERLGVVRGFLVLETQAPDRARGSDSRGRAGSS